MPTHLHSRAQPSQSRNHQRRNTFSNTPTNDSRDNNNINNRHNGNITNNITSIFTARNVHVTENLEERMQDEFDNIDRVREQLNEDRYNASIAEITQNVLWRFFICVMLHMSWFGWRYFYAKPSSKMFVASDGSSSDAETTKAILLFTTEINFWKEFMNTILFTNYLAAWEPFGPLFCVLPLLDICIALLEFFTNVMMSNNLGRFIREYETAEFINRTSNPTPAIRSSHSPHTKNNVNTHATCNSAADPDATSSSSPSTRYKAYESDSAQLERPLQPVRSNYHSIEEEEEEEEEEYEKQEDDNEIECNASHIEQRCSNKHYHSFPDINGTSCAPNKSSNNNMIWNKNSKAQVKFVSSSNSTDNNFLQWSSSERCNNHVVNGVANRCNQEIEMQDISLITPSQQNKQSCTSENSLLPINAKTIQQGKFINGVQQTSQTNYSNCCGYSLTPTTTFTTSDCCANEVTHKSYTTKKCNDQMEQDEIEHNLQSRHEKSYTGEREPPIASDIVIVRQANSHVIEHEMKTIPLGRVCNEEVENLEVLNYNDRIMYDTCASAEQQLQSQHERQEREHVQGLLHCVNALRLFVFALWHSFRHIYANTNNDIPIHVRFALFVRRLSKKFVTALRECVNKVDAKYRIREIVLDGWRSEMFVILPDASVATPHTASQKEQRQYEEEERTYNKKKNRQEEQEKQEKYSLSANAN